MLIYRSFFIMKGKFTVRVYVGVKFHYNNKTKNYNGQYRTSTDNRIGKGGPEHLLLSCNNINNTIVICDIIYTLFYLPTLVTNFLC